jgi:hypothetical protein
MTILFGRTQDCFGTPFDKTIKNVLVAEEAQSAIDELTVLINSVVRIVLLNTYNGTWTNNSFLGRNELLPSTGIRFARQTTVTEIVFNNQNTTKNFFLDVYKNGTTTLVTTLTVNTTTGVGQSFINLNIPFLADETLFFRYRNISGTSPSDSTIEVYAKITG